ncbi:MAG: TonB-dependent receptor [Acidobacteriales bacterium]|nr:TonB-dependent receptor [Terriglobales bacterium]
MHFFFRRHASVIRILILFAFVLSSISAINAQGLGGVGTIQGKVMDPTGAIIPGATVEVRNVVSGYQRTTVTDDTGQFVFRNVPQNMYHLAVTASGFAMAQQDLELRSSVPQNLSFTLEVSSSKETVEVTAEAGDLLETTPSAHTDIDQSLVARLPMETAVSGLSSTITLATPGVVADSNGFFHPLGDHAQATFSIDSQPISDQQSRIYSNQISTNAVQSMEVISGVAPAEYGDKSSLVSVVTTKSGLGLLKPTGSINAGYGSFGSPSGSINLGFGGVKWGNFVSVNGLRSGRFLDSPEFGSFHNKGNAETFFDRIDFQPRASDSFHLDLFAARSWFQAPNTFDQLAVGQDQRQRIESFNIAPGWTHLFSANLLLTANAYFRQDRVDYYPSNDPAADLPATVGQGRRLSNTGARFDLSYNKGVHNVKGGFQFSRTFLSENFRFGITDPTSNPVCLDGAGDPVLDPSITDSANCAGAGFVANPGLKPGLVPFDLTRGGALLQFRDRGAIDQQALYLQDTISWKDWTLMLGLRGDHYKGLSEGYALAPRTGVSYHFKRTNTILRAAYGHTLETPYNENLLLSSATGVGGLANNPFGSVVSAPIRPGRRNQYNVGFQQAFGRFFVVDGEYFWKYTANAYDFNTLGDTSIAFPIAWNKSKLDGFSMRVSLPEIHGFRAFAVMGHTRARYFNPEVGGLFFDTNPQTGVFRIDHDQAFQQTTNVQYSFLKKHGGWIGFTWRYDSGLVNGAVPDYATALTLSPAEQAAIGLFCGNVFATRTAPITSCSDPHQGATRIVILPLGTEDDDHNPPRIAPRHLFDLGLGSDNLFRADHYKITAKFSVLNLANKVALYNFQSTFSGTHFVAPRTYQAELGFTF